MDDKHLKKGRTVVGGFFPLLKQASPPPSLLLTVNRFPRELQTSTPALPGTPAQPGARGRAGHSPAPGHRCGRRPPCCPPRAEGPKQEGTTFRGAGTERKAFTTSFNDKKISTLQKPSLPYLLLFLLHFSITAGDIRT